jgi:nitrogen regulatory protein PII
MSYKMITAVITDSKSTPILEALAEKGVATANRSKARGTSIRNENGVEMEILTVLVEDKKADEVFTYIYEEANIVEPHHGMIYQQEIKKASNYKLK